MCNIQKDLRKLFNNIIKGEQGQVIPLALIMLVLGSTIVAGTLTYAGTTINTSYISKFNQTQLYAADTGAKDALWRFKHDYYTIVGKIGTDEWIYKPSPVNDQEIEVTAAYVSKDVYWVTSEAYSNGSSATVDLLLSGISVFFTNPAVAKGTIDNKGSLIPNKYLENYNNFPTATSLRTYYQSPPHPSLTHVPGGTIDTTGNLSIGDIYYEGDITITGSGTLTLTGNLFVDGDINFANDSWEIDLGQHTIYATGSMVQAKKKGYFNGPGCLIAEGDIGLWPQSQAGYENKYIFIMSVLGAVELKPNGSFYGSCAAGGGGVSLQLEPGATVTLTTLPLGGLDFPDDPDTYEWSVSNWRSTHEFELFIITSVYAPGEVNIPYSQTTIAKNGVPPYSWSVVSGTLPNGLNFASDGTISGTPTTATGTPSPVFTVQVTDSTGDTATRDMTIGVQPVVDIPVQTLPDGEEGVTYLQSITVTGGVAPYTEWLVTSGSLPTGLLLDPDTGEISGVPPSASSGTYNFSVSMKDALGGIDIQPLYITVVP